MVQIRHYRLIERGGIFFCNSKRNKPLSDMPSIVNDAGDPKKVLFKNEEEKLILVIRRLYCTNCKRIHHELPDCIVPYKRYSAEIIENIVNGHTKDVPCPAECVNRLRNWWEAVKPYFLQILLTLVEKYGVSFGEPPAFRETVRAAANSNNWIFAHQVCTRSPARPG